MHCAGKMEGMPKQCWYILTEILCLGEEGGGVRQQTSPAAWGGPADPVGLCPVVEAAELQGSGQRLQAPAPMCC